MKWLAVLGSIALLSWFASWWTAASSPMFDAPNLDPAHHPSLMTLETLK